MKKLLLLITLFSSPFIYSQVGIPQVVNDPQANTSLATRIAQGATQVKNGIAQIEFLKDAKEIVTTVNSVLRDVNEIEEIYTLQVKILNKSTTQVKKLRDSKQFTTKEMSLINQSYSSILDNTFKSLETLEKLLTDDMFTMKDAERLEFIREIRSELQQRYVNADGLYMKYINIAQTRIQSEVFKKSKK